MERSKSRACLSHCTLVAVTALTLSDPEHKSVCVGTLKKRRQTNEKWKNKKSNKLMKLENELGKREGVKDKGSVEGEDKKAEQLLVREDKMFLCHFRIVQETIASKQKLIYSWQLGSASPFGAF
jgi:hypothetical protein